MARVNVVTNPGNGRPFQWQAIPDAAAQLWWNRMVSPHQRPQQQLPAKGRTKTPARQGSLKDTSQDQGQGHCTSHPGEGQGHCNSRALKTKGSKNIFHSF